VVSGQNNELFARPAQNGSGTASANQELMGNNFGGGAFANPTVATSGITKNSSSITLNSNSTYTADMLITYLAGGNISVAETLYQGAGTGGSNLGTDTIASTAPVVTSFDGLGFGVRTTSSAAIPTADISEISVTYTPANIPEPATFGMLALTGLGLVQRRRRKT
jgi:hypothetical protein